MGSDTAPPASNPTRFETDPTRTVTFPLGTTEPTPPRLTDTDIALPTAISPANTLPDKDGTFRGTDSSTALLLALPTDPNPNCPELLRPNPYSLPAEDTAIE
jgi:hypothetical protein